MFATKKSTVKPLRYGQDSPILMQVIIVCFVTLFGTQPSWQTIRTPLYQRKALANASLRCNQLTVALLFKYDTLNMLLIVSGYTVILSLLSTKELNRFTMYYCPFCSTIRLTPQDLAFRRRKVTININLPPKITASGEKHMNWLTIFLTKFVSLEFCYLNSRLNFY